MIDSDDYKFMLFACLIIAVVVITSIAINVGTQHSCKMAAISAGMKSQEVQESCK